MDRSKHFLQILKGQTGCMDLWLVQFPKKHLFHDKLSMCWHVTWNLGVLCHHKDSRGSWSGLFTSGSDGLRKRATSSPGTSGVTLRSSAGPWGKRVLFSAKQSSSRRTVCGCQTISPLSLFQLRKLSWHGFFMGPVQSLHALGSTALYETGWKGTHSGQLWVGGYEPFFFSPLSCFQFSKLSTGARITFKILKMNFNSRWQAIWKRQWVSIETPRPLSSQDARRLLVVCAQEGDFSRRAFQKVLWSTVD